MAARAPAAGALTVALSYRAADGDGSSRQARARVTPCVEVCASSAEAGPGARDALRETGSRDPQPRPRMMLTLRSVPQPPAPSPPTPPAVAQHENAAAPPHPALAAAKRPSTLGPVSADSPERRTHEAPLSAPREATGFHSRASRTARCDGHSCQQPTRTRRFSRRNIHRADCNRGELRNPVHPRAPAGIEPATGNLPKA